MTGRGAFLGPLGGLVEFVHYKGSSGSQEIRGATFKTTLGGTRKAFLDPDRGLREWSVSTAGLGPEEFAKFELLTAGAYGPPPFRWVDHIAQVTNILTPRRSMPGVGNEFAWTGSAPAGPAVSVEGLGTVEHSIATAGVQVFFAWYTPVIPGVPVTGSVYATGHNGTNAALYMRFYKPDGTFTSTSGRILTNQDATLKRISTTGTPPEGSTYALLTVTNSGALALPAITWTDKVMPWSKGRGAEKAVVSGISDDVVDADPNSDNGRIVDFSFTVTEVGAGA